MSDVRFYNAGGKIDVLIPFSLPEGSDIHASANWPFIAPKEAWFDVPTEIEVGHNTLSVKFGKDIRERYGKWGVIQLDPLWSVEKEDADADPEKYPVAATEELVIEKGKAIWKRHLRRVVEGHLNDCQNAMSAGGAPRAASGFTKHALQLLGIADPGEQYFLNLSKGVSGGQAGMSADVTAILASQGKMMQSMMSVVIAMASGQKIDPETLKEALEPAAVPGVAQTAVMSGKIVKPVDMRGAGPDAEIFDRKVKSKHDRAQAAVAAL